MQSKTLQACDFFNVNSIQQSVHSNVNSKVSFPSARVSHGFLLERQSVHTRIYFLPMLVLRGRLSNNKDFIKEWEIKFNAMWSNTHDANTCYLYKSCGYYALLIIVHMLSKINSFIFRTFYPRFAGLFGFFFFQQTLHCSNKAYKANWIA